jgi:hypothetical protein
LQPKEIVMKFSELSFADAAALEVFPALVSQSRFFGENPEAAMAKCAYAHADALSAERDRRNNLRGRIVEALRLRAERAEASAALLRNMNEDGQFGPRVALEQLWEMLGVDNQTAAAQRLRTMKTAIDQIASCQLCFPGDTVDIARKARGQ